jgi:hypothetical protein
MLSCLAGGRTRRTASTATRGGLAGCLSPGCGASARPPHLSGAEVVSRHSGRGWHGFAGNAFVTRQQDKRAQAAARGRAFEETIAAADDLLEAVCLRGQEAGSVRDLSRLSRDPLAVVVGHRPPPRIVPCIGEQSDGAQWSQCTVAPAVVFFLLSPQCRGPDPGREAPAGQVPAHWQAA